MLSVVGTNKVQRLILSKKKNSCWFECHPKSHRYHMQSLLLHDHTSWFYIPYLTFTLYLSTPVITACVPTCLNSQSHHNQHILLFLTFCFTHMALKLAAVILSHLHIMTFSSCPNFSVLSGVFSAVELLKKDMKELALPSQIFLLLGCWKAQLSLFISFFLSTNAWYKNILDISTFTGTLVSFPRPQNIQTVSIYMKIIMEILIGVCVAVNMNSFQHYTSNHGNFLYVSHPLILLLLHCFSSVFRLVSLWITNIVSLHFLHLWPWKHKKNPASNLRFLHKFPLVE